MNTLQIDEIYSANRRRSGPITMETKQRMLNQLLVASKTNKFLITFRIFLGPRARITDEIK